MLNLSFRYRFEAAHRFLGSESETCTTPHGHTWHAVLNLTFTGEGLNGSQMAVEFAELKRDWKRLLTETFDHSYLHHFQDPIVEAIRATQPKARLIPFPGDPTTELIGLLLFHKMATIISKSPFAKKVEVHSITVEETPTNTVVCGREFYSQEIEKLNKYSGWWTSTESNDRSFQLV